jgi:hypothetical protein
MKLASEAFDKQQAPIVFGWILTGHQLGAATAAFGAGVIREQASRYLFAFVAAGAMGQIAAGLLLLSLACGRGLVPEPFGQGGRE